MIPTPTDEQARRVQLIDQGDRIRRFLDFVAGYAALTHAVDGEVDTGTLGLPHLQHDAIDAARDLQELIDEAKASWGINVEEDEDPRCLTSTTHPAASLAAPAR